LQKIFAKNLFYFLQCEFISSFTDSQKASFPKKCCLVLPGYTQKAKKALDNLLKKTIAKFCGKSARFQKLALDPNICIVMENERNFKKLFVKTKII
jgi:hypothetical protein